MKRIVSLLLLVASCGGSSGSSVTTPTTGAQLVIDDDDFDFDPTVAQTPTSPASFIITNTGGTRSGQLSVAVSGDDDYAFAITDDQCTNQILVASETCRVSVALGASHTGVYEADLRISGLPGGLGKAHLHGEVVAETLVVTPIAFGGVAPGQVSAALTVDITNASSVASGALALQPFASGELAVIGDTCTGQSLGSGKSCALQLTYTPAIGDHAPLTDALVVSGPFVGTVSQPISGQPSFPAALSVDDYDFGPYGSHFGPFATHTMTVTNSGSIAAKVGSVQLGNPTLSGFAIAADHCTGTSLAGGASCDVDVRSLSYNLSVSTSAALTDTLTVKLQSGASASAKVSGVVTLDYVTSVITVTPAGAGIVSSSDGQSCNGMGSCVFFWPLHPQPVTLTATPATTANVFDTWVANVGGVCSASPTSSLCSLTPVTSLQITAIFR